MKNQKGITLVALVITIIVMLILVGVTVNVALTGGLFDTAKEAKAKTIEEQEKEQLMSIVLGKYNIETDTIEITESELPEGWTKSGEIYVSPKGNKFTVTEDRVVEKYEVPWYNLTDDEITEISNAGATEVDEDGRGVYIIATVEEDNYKYSIGVGSTGNGNVEMMTLEKLERDPDYYDEYNYVGALVFLISEEWVTTYQQIMPSIQANTWYYAPAVSQFGSEGTVEFSGDITEICPTINNWISSTDSNIVITSPSYLKRIIENFNK